MVTHQPSRSRRRARTKHNLRCGFRFATDPQDWLPVARHHSTNPFAPRTLGPLPRAGCDHTSSHGSRSAFAVQEEYTRQHHSRADGWAYVAKGLPSRQLHPRHLAHMTTGCTCCASLHRPRVSPVVALKDQIPGVVDISVGTWRPLSLPWMRADNLTLAVLLARRQAAASRLATRVIRTVHWCD